MAARASKKKNSKTTAVKKKTAPKAVKAVDFLFFAPLSKKVLLGGDFNSWNAKKNSLKKSDSGIWKTSLKLKPGRYEYRFNIDGGWENDNQRQTELAGNSFGQTNNILIIG